MSNRKWLKGSSAEVDLLHDCEHQQCPLFPLRRVALKEGLVSLLGSFSPARKSCQCLIILHQLRSMIGLIISAKLHQYKLKRCSMVKLAHNGI